MLIMRNLESFPHTPLNSPGWVHSFTHHALQAPSFICNPLGFQTDSCSDFSILSAYPLSILKPALVTSFFLLQIFPECALSKPDTKWVTGDSHGQDMTLCGRQTLQRNDCIAVAVRAAKKKKFRVLRESVPGYSGNHLGCWWWFQEIECIVLSKIY